MPDNNPAQDPRQTDQTRKGPERTRPSSNRDRQLERSDATPQQDRDRGEAVRGKSRDTDPDSPDADVDRDDMIDEP
jgi:hypothetical protein